MKQYTEEDRAALIEWIEEGVLCAEEFGFKGNVRKCMEIALAALTATPVEREEVETLMYWEKPLYTTPPVAALRLPKPAAHHCDPRNRGEFYHEMECRAWDLAISEVKRLNATAPAEEKK